MAVEDMGLILPYEMDLSEKHIVFKKKKDVKSSIGRNNG
jgi:hypothetical protein